MRSREGRMTGGSKVVGVERDPRLWGRSGG